VGHFVPCIKGTGGRFIFLVKFHLPAISDPWDNGVALVV
jgi:hypothetical protein